MFSRISYPSRAFRAIDSSTLIAHDSFTGDFSGAKGSSWLKSEEDKKEVRPVNLPPPPSSAPSLTDRLWTIFEQSLDFVALLADTFSSSHTSSSCDVRYYISGQVARSQLSTLEFYGRAFYICGAGSLGKATYTFRERHKQVECIDQGRIFGAAIRLHGYRAKGLSRKENHRDSFTESAFSVQVKLSSRLPSIRYLRERGSSLVRV